ncbi:MAG: D-glycero-beta-D-manno-heptose 1-phosphate adenylyltransferase [Gammaproteobacteria bacterium]|nr:D-glycero-beta-D-manno-heptose 1-phosphate adenylyltransferase [Gammaproteobacteria bacterium]MDE2875778.1 D-glycero-beta-D-manno-heptose 1-phosphate adenylyltransferase [Gemmatimonadota bacterium]
MGRALVKVRAAGEKILERAEVVERLGPGRSFRLVFTNGCFDLLHPGHVDCLERARRLGDALLVAVNTDRSVRGLGKGPGRPLVDQDVRARMVAALGCVDWVTLFDEETPEQLIAEVRPDVLVKGGDYSEEDVAGAEVVRGGGGRVVIMPLVPGFSTSALVRRIREGR